MRSGQQWAIIAYFLMSWIPALSQSELGRFLAKIVEPYIALFRRFIPRLGMFDLASIVAFMAYNIVLRPVVLGLVKSILPLA